MEQKRQLEEQIGHLLGQLVGLSKYPDTDPCQDGDVIYFEKTYPDSDKRFSYVAIRANGGEWYTTAGKTPSWFSNWDALCAWMGRGVDKVYKMEKTATPLVDGETAKSEFFAEMRRQIVGIDPKGNAADLGG
jgi:hypothetical protein